MTDAESKFRNFLTQLKVDLPHEKTIVYGRLEKYDDPERIGTSGNAPAHWYILFDNPWGLCGEVGTFDTSKNFTKKVFTSFDFVQLTEDQKLKYQKQKEESKEQYDKYIAEVFSTSRKLAKERWEKSSDQIPPFEWLEKKKLKSDGVRYCKKEDCLIVPGYDIEGVMQCYQRIWRKPGELKKTGTDTKIRGAFSISGSLRDSHTVYVGESWANGQSAYESTGQCGVGCFGAGNVITVAISLKDRYPDKNIYLLQDLGDEGEKVASNWKLFIKTEIFKPSEDDFSHVFATLGANAVREILSPFRLPIISMNKFMSIPKPPLQWNVDNFLLKNMLGVCYGLPGSGKSTLLLQLAYCLTSQTPFFERSIPEPRRVLYIDAEMGDQLLESTWNIILKSNDTNETPELLDILELDYMDETKIDISTDLWKKRLDDVFGNYDVIILDNYLKLIPTVDYDQQHKVWTPIFEWLRPWAKKRNKCILFGHHSVKGGSMRGASEMNNDLDFTLCLKRNPREKDYLSIQIEFGDKRRGIHPKYTHPFQCDLLENGWVLGPVEPEPTVKEKREQMQGK